MSNFATTLKAEITRLARKEIRAQIEPLKKLGTAQKREIAELKRQVSVLARNNRPAKRPTRSPKPAAGSRPPRFSAKGLRRLRARLALSAVDFGKLVGASGQSIYGWETGKTLPRDAHKASLAGLRAIGKKEARDRLAKAA